MLFLFSRYILLRWYAITWVRFYCVVFIPAKQMLGCVSSDDHRMDTADPAIGIYIGGCIHCSSNNSLKSMSRDRNTRLRKCNQGNPSNSHQDSSLDRHFDLATFAPLTSTVIRWPCNSHLIDISRLCQHCANREGKGRSITIGQQAQRYIHSELLRPCPRTQCIVPTTATH